jgi:hypothetical protein
VVCPLITLFIDILGVGLVIPIPPLASSAAYPGRY